MIQFKEIKWAKCYCGGWVRSVLTEHKKQFFGWKFFHYKKPRWQLDNCYPRKFEEGKYGQANPS